MCIGLKGDTWSRQRLRISESHPRGTVITTTPPTRLQAKCVLVKTKQKKTVECDGSQRNMLSLPTFHISIRVFVPWRSLKETEFKNLPNFPARGSVPLVQRAKNQKPTPRSTTRRSWCGERPHVGPPGAREPGARGQSLWSNPKLYTMCGIIFVEINKQNNTKNNTQNRIRMLVNIKTKQKREEAKRAKK